MSTPAYLPGTLITQADLDLLLARAPAPYPTWFEFLFQLQPEPLTPVPIWYSTLVAAEQLAGRVTAEQRSTLLTVPFAQRDDQPPTSLLAAWDQLMQSFGVTWPKRRKATMQSVDRMTSAVARARKAALRG